jgi:RNA polymerase-binding protein DksA
LFERKSALLEEVRAHLVEREDQNPVGLLGLEPGDSGDLSMADALADLDIAMMDRQIRELRDIEAAYGRIRERTFGECSDCGDDISLARLHASPAAKRCMACQEKFEQVHAHEGHPRL